MSSHKALGCWIVALGVIFKSSSFHLRWKLNRQPSSINDIILIKDLIVFLVSLSQHMIPLNWFVMAFDFFFSRHFPPLNIRCCFCFGITVVGNRVLLWSGGGSLLNIIQIEYILHSLIHHHLLMCIIIGIVDILFWLELHKHKSHVDQLLFKYA